MESESLDFIGLEIPRDYRIKKEATHECDIRNQAAL